MRAKMVAMDLLIGTKNKGKVIEIAEALGALRIRCVGAHDAGITEDPIETGATFAENALLKARHYFGKMKKSMPTLADDSGIIVEALAEELGIHTRRWGAGASANDEEWIECFLKRMASEKNKRARFVCVLAYIDAQGEERLFEGACDGVITESLEAGYLPGLPISACFKPDGYNCVYSAMKVEQKNYTSHRGRAVEKFRRYLADTKT